ncbi:YafY family protein [Synechococcus sp. PCC 7336]|uniref:helix-turn-helix transcriptional regulator n=1 Tax=Synechococcus sp. PCC 7336 TaxID=195250 RepID=UPI00034A9F35|nr:transcriptional regulator [Synechococcus sp. PCC 7336]
MIQPRYLERLLHLDALLRSANRHTTKTLAAELEVSDRTIRSDLAFLRDRFGAPLEYSRSRGHHYTETSWQLSSVPITDGELFALTLGARMLKAYSGSVYQRQLESAIARLATRLPEQEWVDLQQMADEQILFRSGAEIDLDPAIWHGLETACLQSRSVWMTYYTAGRNVYNERKVDPYLLHIYRGTNPYLIGYCHRRKEIRWFRVDRIQQLQVLEELFQRDPTFDARDHLAMIFQHEVGGVAQVVRIWFDAATAPFIRERRWHPSQALEEHSDGSLTLQMEVGGMNDLKRWVLGYGRGARVLQPPELVEMVRGEVEQMCKLYCPVAD